MNVLLRNPRREIQMPGPTSVSKLLKQLNIVPESVLVICNDELVTRDAQLRDEDSIEIRPVVSGGA